MWYYEQNGKPFGPVSKETIAEELKDGKITLSTRVWREGMFEWKRLEESELANLVGIKPPKEEPGAEVKKPRLQLDPLSLKRLFWSWFWLMLISTFFSLLAQVFSNQPWVVSLFCFITIPLLAAVVLLYFLLYRFWQVVQDDQARTTPGRAVAFLFIPFFQLYWYFVAFHGLSKELSRYSRRLCATRASVNIPPTHPALSMAFVISFLVSTLYTMIQYFWLLTSSPDSFGDAALFPHFSLSTSLLSILLFIVRTALMLGTLWEFHQTAQGILAAEENRPNLTVSG